MTTSPTLSNSDINLECSRCGSRLLWEASRNGGTGKVELYVQCGCDGFDKRATVELSVQIDRKFWGTAEASEPSI